MAIVYAKTKKAKYAARTNYFNKIHISVPADRIVTSWLDMCYTMHYPELLSSLKYYEIICHYKVTNRDKIKAFCICWTPSAKKARPKSRDSTRQSTFIRAATAFSSTFG